MKRIRGNYRFIVSFNLGLILCGVAGILQPTTSALLHNTSTLFDQFKEYAESVGLENRTDRQESAPVLLGCNTGAFLLYRGLLYG